uniref:Uncharacterized protein n=1 Tax=Glossina pallidipes TaxID=7398 RepID=A0A1A9ZD92_GLOPL
MMARNFRRINSTSISVRIKALKGLKNPALHGYTNFDLSNEEQDFQLHEKECRLHTITVLLQKQWINQSINPLSKPTEESKQSLMASTLRHATGVMFAYNDLTVSPSRRRSLMGDSGILVTEANNSAPRKVGIEISVNYVKLFLEDELGGKQYIEASIPLTSGINNEKQYTSIFSYYTQRWPYGAYSSRLGTHFDITTKNS